MKKPLIMIAPTAIRKNFLPAAFAALAFFALSTPAHADDKPSGWADAVNSAADKKPLFWLDGNPDINEGSELIGQVRYRQKVWGEPKPGFWSEARGAFGTGDSRGVGVVVDSESTAAGCSESGALALLFRTPSEFQFGGDLPPDKHGLFSRGDLGTAAPFGVAIVNGSLRVAAPGQNDKPQYTYSKEKLTESTWYWFAMSWKASGGSTEVTWHLFAPKSGGHIDDGAFATKGLGESDSEIFIAGIQSAHSATDTLLSQVIVWDTPVSESAWTKLEAQLK